MLRIGGRPPFTTGHMLDTADGQTESPNVNTVIKLDDQRRGVFPEPFKPGDTLLVASLGPEAISLRLIKPTMAPTLETRWIKGRLFGAEVELDRSELAAAVRAEREER